MRKLHRRQLPKSQKAYLRKKQKEVNANSGLTVEKTWKNARKTKVMEGVAEVLRQIAGNRQRCMFCLDSRGVAIEHFWPKKKYYSRAFRWTNMLLVCDDCNRIKGERFDFHNGQPKLINPLAEDPWDHLFYEPITGQLAAAVDAGTGLASIKGAYTIDPDVLRLNDDVIAEGRRETYRNLRRAVQGCLDHLAAGRPLAAEQDELIQAVNDNDHFALAQWYFRKHGSTEQPFASLRAQHPGVWAAVEASII